MSIEIQMSEMPEGGILQATLTKTGLQPGETFDLDILQSTALETALGQLSTQTGRKIILNLSQVGYMDSKTFWATVRAARTITSQGGQLVMAHVHENIVRLLKLTGAEDIVKCFDSIESAAASLESQ